MTVKDAETTQPESELPLAAQGNIADLFAAWGLTIDPELIVVALTHRSFAYENGNMETNERMEFLGDAVLQLIVTEKLYRVYPDHPEGHLAKMRAATVSQPALAHAARRIKLGEFILLGKGELKSGGGDKDSILSDTFEALIGATFLSHGLEPTRHVVEAALADLLSDVVHRGAGMDWKATLRALTREQDMQDPEFTTDSTGPDHNRVFHSQVLIGSVVWGKGEASSKKAAEHAACHDAVITICDRLGIDRPNGL